MYVSIYKILIHCQLEITRFKSEVVFHLPGHTFELLLHTFVHWNQIV